MFSDKIRNFVPMNYPNERPTVSCDNIIIVDADFVDRVAFDLIVNFERMIGRKIPNADMARWIDCVALDGGVREGKDQTQVVLIHSAKSERLENFTPGHFANELNGQAFTDNLGEFTINAYTDEKIISKEDLLIDTLQLCCASDEVKRIMVVPDEDYYDRVSQALRHTGDNKTITVFAMQPMTGGGFRQEILGYSLMSALGIRGEELSSS